MGVKISELTTTTIQEGMMVPGSIGGTTYKYNLGNMPIAVSSLSQIVNHLQSNDKTEYAFFLKKDINLTGLSQPIQVGATQTCYIHFFGARLIFNQDLELTFQQGAFVEFHNPVNFSDAALMFSCTAGNNYSVQITIHDLQITSTQYFDKLYNGGAFGGIVSQYSAMIIKSHHPELFYGFSSPGANPGLFTSEPINKPTATIVQNMLGYDLSPTLKPNVFYIWNNPLSDSDTLTLTLGAELPFVANEYMGQFTTDSTAPTVNWPSGVTWVGGTPTIAAGKTYQFSILSNIGLIVEI